MFKLTLRNLAARKLRLVMSGMAIVLGIAFLSGVMVFSNGLDKTFDGIINGSTPDAVVQPSGSSDFDPGTSGVSTATLTPEVVAHLAALPEVERADGNVTGFGMSLLAADRTLVGGTGAPTLAFNHTDGPNMDGGRILQLRSGAWPAGTEEIVLDEAAARNGDYDLGDEVHLVAPYGQIERSAELVGIAEFNGGGTAGATLLIFSTEGAQEVFLGGSDQFNQIALTATDGLSQTDLVSAVADSLPDGFEAVTGDEVAAASQDAIGEFTGIISIFLTVFAVIAIIVGGFIIINTFTILIAQRSGELALLRALGASRRQVVRSVLLEAFVMAAVASTLGIVLGLGLARGLAGVFRWIGLDIAGNALGLTTQAVVTGYSVGIVVTVLAAYLPARRAGRVSPVAAMRPDSAPDRRSMRRRAVIGILALGLGALFAVLGLADVLTPSSLWVGAGGVVWILTVAVIAPVIGRPILAACRSGFAALFGTTGRVAGENALRDPRRTGATASALMIGLALVSTIGVLAASLNATIDDQVDEEFTADFLVQSANFLPFAPAIGDAIESVDGVATMSRQQWATGALAGDTDDTVSVAGNSPGFDDIYALEMVEGTQAVGDGQAIVYDQFADQHQLGPGDRFEVTFPAGAVLDLTVVGVFEATEVTASVTVSLETLAQAGLTRQDSAISILAEPGADLDALHDALESAAEPMPLVGVSDKQQFADSLRGQINQLLYIIYGLLALAIIIAVFGIVNTLGLSVMERTREIGLLRAIGMSRARLRRMVTLESVAIAVLGATLGLALGLLIGVLLQQSMSGELTSLGLPTGQLVAFGMVAVAVGVLAAVVPGIRAARLDVLDAIATE